MRGPDNTAGRTTAIAVITPLRPWWTPLLRLEMLLLAAWKRLIGQDSPSRPVKRLSFITFAHWAMIDRVPAEASRNEATRLPHTYTLFHSNYNGASHEYFEAFARGLTWRMRGLWLGGYGVPDASQLAEFSEYIGEHTIDTDHYYSAYPQASTKMVLQALAMREPFERFQDRAQDLDPDDFAAAYAEFVAEAQKHL